MCTYQLSETVEIVSGFIGPRKSIQKNWRICSNIFQRKYFENLFKATNFPDARGKFLLQFFYFDLPRITFFLELAGKAPGWI